MATEAFQMPLLHAAFRNELHSAVSLIREVPAGNTKRAKIVGRHLDFVATALYHHHAAEDEVIWPLLHSRARPLDADIARMEDAHREIDADVTRVRDITKPWTKSADTRLAEQLVAAVEELCSRVDEHFVDEETNIVPLVDTHLEPEEWQKFIDLGARFLWKHPELGLVMGGLVVDAGSAAQGERFLANVPLPQRTVFRLLGMRTLAAYRAKVYGSPLTSSR